MKPAKFTTAQRLSLAAICVAYVLVRFWGLTASCLWFDEIFSVHAAEHSWGSLNWFVSQDLIHPPFFYFVLKVWLAGGEGLFWLRLLPVLFSVLALAPFLYLCRELKLKFSTVALALTLFAVNGALIKYAQEVRMYSMLLFLSLVSIWLFTRFFYRGKNIWILTLANVLLVYTHYFGWLVIIAEAAIVLVFQRIKLRHVLVMMSLVFLSFTPWLLMVWKAWKAGADFHQNIGWIAPPMPADIAGFLIDALEPFYSQQSSIDPSSLFYISVPLLLLIALGSLFYFSEFRGREDKTSLYVLGLLVTVPTVFAFVLSWLMPVSVWGSRHLIIVFPAVSILASIFLTEISANVLRRIVVSLVLVITAAAFVIRARTEPETYIWCAWEQLVRADANGETIYVFEDLTAYHMWFATRSDNGPQIIKVNSMPEMVEDTAYFLPRGFDGVKTINADEIAGERFWIAVRDMQWNEKHPPLNFLVSKGFKIGEPISIDVNGLKAFMVEIGK